MVLKQKKVARSVDDLFTIANAKDAMVDSILSELSNLKGDMVATLEDYMMFEKMSAPLKKVPKDGLGPLSKAAMDPSLPFKQRMVMIGQIFDSLTELQRNITTIIQSAISTKFNEGNSLNSIPEPYFNTTFLDAIKSKLETPDYSNVNFSKNAMPLWIAYSKESSGNGIKRNAGDFPMDFTSDADLEKRHNRNDHLNRGQL